MSQLTLCQASAMRELEQNYYYNQHMSHQHRKIFPLRLPENYHGVPAAKPSLIERTLLKMQERPMGNPEQLSPSRKVTTWQKKRFDSDIVRQRRELLVHPAKLSEENPDWIKTTFDYFRRNQMQPRKRETRAQWESYDVFGRPRGFTYASETPVARTRFSSQIQVTSKVGYESRFRSSGFKEVTPKVGSVDVRDLSIRRPQMKIGKTEFIDTYTPF